MVLLEEIEIWGGDIVDVLWTKGNSKNWKGKVEGNGVKSRKMKIGEEDITICCWSVWERVEQCNTEYNMKIRKKCLWCSIKQDIRTLYYQYYLDGCVGIKFWDCQIQAVASFTWWKLKTQELYKAFSKQKVPVAFFTWKNPLRHFLYEKCLHIDMKIKMFKAIVWITFSATALHWGQHLEDEWMHRLLWNSMMKILVKHVCAICSLSWE